MRTSIDCTQDVKNIPDFAYKIVQSRHYTLYTRNLSLVAHLVPMRLFNHQSKKEARRDIARHYDLGLELFGHFLDKNMNYSCGYWRNAKNLDEAQVNKMNLIGRKLKLEKGKHFFAQSAKLAFMWRSMKAKS